MKKLLSALIVIVAFFAFSVKAAELDLPEKTDREPVKIYLFYADWCHNCHNFITYFLNNYKDEFKDYFEVVGIEAGAKTTTDAIKNNYELAIKVKDYFKIADDDFGWPFIVIGNNKIVGFGQNSGASIMNLALKEYSNKDYKDVVKPLIEKSSKEITTDTLKEAASKANLLEENASTSTTSEEKKNDGNGIIYFIIVFVVVVGGLGSIVLFSKK